MDAESFLEFASQVTKWKMYPYFDVAHSVLCALHVRDDLGPGALAFSRKHPISCWLSTMLVVFAGGILSAALLGEPPLAPLKNTQQLVIASAVWYLVFYTPFDIGYSVAKFLPVKLTFSVMKEIYRCKKVHDGVLHAAKLYPNAYIIMVIVGTLKGNGASFTKIIERLLRGVWTPTSIETLQPSFTTKACVIASVVFVLDIKSDLISAPHAFVYVFVIGFFIYFKVFSSMILGIHEPMLPFENLICALFFGGIFDYTTKAFKSSKDDKADTKKKIDYE